MKKRVKKIIIVAVALLLFLIFTNPSILFFLPKSTRNSLALIWTGALGDVGKVTGIVKFNWIVIFQLIAATLVMVLVYNISKLVAERIKPKTGKGMSIHSMTGSFITYAIVLIGCIWGFSIIGINISTIFASIGIITLIVGFAAESLIADIITGIFLVFEDEFNVGDIIEIDGFRGTVISIGIRVTCIQDVGGNIKVINNSNVRDILNRSKAKSVAVCDLPVSYSTDIERLEKVLEERLPAIRKKYPDVFIEDPVNVGLQELASSSVNMRIVATVSETDIYKAARLMNRELFIAMKEENIEIPFTQIVVHNSEDKED